MRMMIMKTAMLAVAIFLALSPTGAWAYSYGDANTEDVAETFKLVVSSLSKSPADWSTAEAAHKERRDEIASHFGKSVAATLDADIKDRKVGETIANYKAILVMNLDRRFDNAIQGIDDYTKAKLLLAKARATFVTLSPYAEAKLSGAKMDSLSADFETALDAIGNPGLFGVGQKDADLNALKAAVNRIYGAIKPLFPYTPYKAPAKPAAGNGTKDTSTASGGKGGAAGAAGTGTTTKPVTSTGSAGQSTKPAADPAKQQAEPEKTAVPAEDKPVDAAPEASEDTSKPADNTSAEETAKPAADAATNDAPATSEPAESNAAAVNSESANSTTTGESTDTADAATNAAVQAAEPDTIDGTKKHAAMAHEDRTNPVVTIGVIAGVIVIGGGAVFWARRKGFF
ncbi:hypothetical protein [Paenibacillus sp. R14(2021)]|uniref:hypothetical protein n=1 Tax=Paenibacillus sp. R14(2021) TaxID=2859228 RepID=UPI001C6138F9|nr:hypothetical protein [Paenibacillus sp. R14(2021)]